MAGQLTFEADAAVGNADGVFDAAYDFGEGCKNGHHETGGGCVVGTPEEIGAEVARLLASLKLADIGAMKYGTADFFVQFTVRLASVPGSKR